VCFVLGSGLADSLELLSLYLHAIRGDCDIVSTARSWLELSND